MGGIFSILSVSLNIACGYAGILSLAQAAFFGVGAYTIALLTVKLAVPFWLAFFLGGILAAFLGILMGFPTLRMRGDYFLMATLGFGEIFTNTLVNSDSLTGGARGVTGIPPASFGGLLLNDDFMFAGLLAVICFLCIGSAYLIKISPLGEVFFAVSEDEEAVAAMGRNPAFFKVLAMSLSAFWAGIAGGLYASYVGFISPNLFTINESILVFTMVLLGGLRSVRGAVLGPFILVTLPEIMRFLGFPPHIAAVARQMLYGFSLVLLMYLRPQGVIGSVKFK